MWYNQLNKWVHEYIWILEVTVIVWPLSKVTQIYTLRSRKAHWSQISCRAFMDGEERKFVQMTKMATMSICGKKPLKIFYRQPWYKALGTQALQSLFKWWSWVDHDLLYGKVNFAF